MDSLRRNSRDMHLLPLLPYHRDADAYDPLFAAPPQCAVNTRAKVDMLNGVHRSWERRKLFTVDSRLAGIPSPLSIIGTAKERKSPNPIANRFRRWLKYPPSASQVEKRAYARLMRDGLLATIRYYGWDPHLFDVPTDADILTLSPRKIRALTHVMRDDLFAQILLAEWPDALQRSPRALPLLALHIGIEAEAPTMELATQECYIAFTQRKPFWRRAREPLFCVPIVAHAAESPMFFTGPQALAGTFSQRGPLRYERLGPGKFILQTSGVLEL